MAHPDDPKNKYLMHYCAESPDVINFYSGTIVLDGKGEAAVEMPGYFAKINKEPRYQLTAVGAAMPNLHVGQEISEEALRSEGQCSFVIAGGAPGGKVCWEVKAVRNDLWVRKNGAPVEVEKEGKERGKYQHPEPYGEPAEKGMHSSTGGKRLAPRR